VNKSGENPWETPGVSTTGWRTDVHGENSIDLHKRINSSFEEKDQWMEVDWTTKLCFSTLPQVLLLLVFSYREE